MHELGLTNAMLRTVEDIAREQNFNTVSSITVEIGELSGVIPSLLMGCWDVVIEGTHWKDTQLKIVNVPGKLLCEDCKMEFPLNRDSFHCPNCGSEKLTPIAGLEMTIRDIEGS